MEKLHQILLTNDDGIHSPGLWAAASALSELGWVTVAAPREQFSGVGRSLPMSSDGVIEVLDINVNGKPWKVHSVGGTPAQVVLHAVLEILPEPPNLLVAGINYGENVGSGVTISGTIGAALEAASLGIPAMAVSLETEQRHHYSNSNEVDFSVAAYFTQYFGRLMLEKHMPADVDVLKVEVPCDANRETPWITTRVSRRRYYEAVAPQRKAWSIPVHLGYKVIDKEDQDQPGTDFYALRVTRCVSITPLSLDLTSRVDLEDFEKILRK
jgi:5'-nucleotidase